MDTEAWPVSSTTSTAAGSSSSPSSSEDSAAAAPLEEPPFSFSCMDSSILAMTSSEYWASPVCLTKATTSSISSGEMKQPWTRILDSPSGA